MRRIRRLLALSLPLALLAIPLATIPATASASETLEIEGAPSLLFGNVTPVFKVDRLVRIPWSLIGGVPPGVPPDSTGFQETFAYDKVFHIQSGATLTVVNTTIAPHTFTVVNRSDQPDNLTAAFGCFATGPCSQSPPITPTIGGVGDGNFLLPGPGTSFSARVIAPAGSVLYFMCIFHPQMQGKLIVEGGD